MGALSSATPCGVAVNGARDQRVRAAVQKEVVHRVAERAVDGEAAKVALELREAGDEQRLSVGPVTVRPTKAVIEVATPVRVRTPEGISST